MTTSEQSLAPQAIDPRAFVTLCISASTEAQAQALLATGSASNWMSEKVAKRIGAQIDDIDDNDTESYQIDGARLEAIGKVEVTWHKDGGKFKDSPNNPSDFYARGQGTCNILFLVVSDGLINVTLGSKVVYSEDLLIYNESALSSGPRV